MACPFFMPTEKYEERVWMHPARLPLGGGWKGHCTAPGHEGERPSEERLREGCNLGYAQCPNRPPESAWDSVRFGVARDGDRRLAISYVCERDHRPAEHGSLEYDVALGLWLSAHRDLRVQKMAECYVESYLLRRNGAAGGNSS